MDNTKELLEQVDKAHEWEPAKYGISFDECRRCELHRGHDRGGNIYFWYGGRVLQTRLEKVAARGCKPGMPGQDEL